MPQFFNMDVNTQVFFERELEAIEQELYNVKYPTLKARLLIPPAFNYPKGTETITYRQYDMLGMAKVVANYATDFPRVSVSGQRFTSNVRRIGDSYAYSIDEIEAAKMANVPLEAMEAMAAKRAIEQLENRIAYFGDDDTGLPGFFSNANIPLTQVENDGDVTVDPGQTQWISKSPAQIIRDFGDAVTAMRELTNGVELPNAALFPIESLAFLSTTPVSMAAPTVMILDVLKKAHPYITLWDDLIELSTAGTGNSRMFVIYNRNPQNLRMPIPWDFEQFPAQEKGLEYEIPCSEKVGGTIVSYPLSISFNYGI